MTRTRCRAAGVAGASLALALLVSGCVGMPDEGPVHESDASAGSSQDRASSIDAVPPRPQAPPVDIVKGFMDAMNAWPIQVDVARQFLSEEAAAAWKPDRATITVADTLIDVSGSVATIDLSEAERLDATGAWQGELPEDEKELRFDLVSEAGEYRISNPPDALIVQDTWFAQRFVQVSLYFFDRTGRILVPEPVFVPRGEQLASTLTTRLLDPGENLQGISRTYLPPVDAGLSVPVSDQGVAQVNLGGGAGTPSPDDLSRMLAQLGWTLRQVPGIRAVRVSIGDEEVSLPGDDAEYGVEEGRQYDPSGPDANPLLFGLRDGRLVYGEPDTLAPAAGPLGEEADHGLRSVSVNLDASEAAGVSADGTSLVRAPVLDDPDARLRTIPRGTDLLPPSWDFADRLWLVDNTPDGARVSYREGRDFSSLRVPGVSGRTVRSFLVSRDGTRYVAVVGGAGGDTLRAGRILVDGQGRVDRAGPSRTIPVEGVDRARITDIAWISPTSVLVLRPVSEDPPLFEVRTVAVDGAPTTAEALTTSVSGRVVALAASADTSTTPYAVTSEDLVDLNSGAAIPFAEGRVTFIDYVG
jgi:hypothetical protein